MDTLTTPVAGAYTAALEPLLAVVDAVPPGGWDAPTPCEGWTARDVLAHLVETQREFLSGRGIDLGPAPDLTDPAAALRDHALRVLAAVGDPAVAEQRYDGYSGPTTVGETLEEFYVWDLVAHRWDLATATGQPYDPPAELVAEAEAFARQTLDPLRDGQTFADAVEPAAGASPIERLAAYTGRRALTSAA